MNARVQKPSTHMLPRQLGRYVFDLIELKQSIHYNMQDSDFADADKRNEIIYVVDADVACMFLSPRDGTESVDLCEALDQGVLVPRKGRHTDRDKPKDKDAKAQANGRTKKTGQFAGLAEMSAAVCVEYLFSGLLPGQRKERARISYQHVFELQNFLDRQLIDADLKWNEVEAEIKSNIAEIKAKLTDKWGDIQIDSMSAEEAARTVSENLPEGLRDWLFVRALAVHQFRRLTATGRERLSPLDGLTSFTAEVETPAPDLVWQWYELIEQHRGAPPGGKRPARRSPQDDRNYRDAVVMAQMQALSALRQSHQRYVFVSGSSALHKAVSHWNADHADEKDKVTFVRHPRQYVALLNMRDIRRSWTHTTATDALAKESVLPALGETVDEILKMFLEAPVAARLLTGFKIEELQQGVERKLQLFEASPGAVKKFDALWSQLHEQWTRLTRASVAYSRGALTDMCDPFFDVVKRLVEGQSRIVDQKLMEQCKGLVGGISRNNALMGVLGALAILKAKMEANKRRPAGQGRSPDYVDYDFVGLIPGDAEGKLNDFLDKVVRSPAAYDRVVAWLSDGSRRAVDANFLVGCIFLKSGDWAHARHFLSKAEEEWRKDTAEDPLYEVRYCLAVAIRLGMTNEAEFLAAKQLNEQCLTYHAGYQKTLTPHTFLIARTHVELAAVNTSWVTALLMQRRPVDPAERKACETRLDHAESGLNKAQHLLDEYADDEGGLDAGARRLLTQLTTNKAGLLTIREFVMGKKDAIRKAADVDTIKAELRRIITRDPDAHALTKLCLHVLTWRSEVDAMKARKAAEDARDLIAANLHTPARAEFARFDIVEMEAIEKVLDGELGPAARRG